MPKTNQLLGNLVNWKGIVASLVLVLVALILLWISDRAGASAGIFVREVLPAFASVVATSGVFALVYEIFVRRQQTDFVLSSIGLKESLIEAGLEQISVNYLDFDYAKEIKEAKVIRLFVLYAHTWLNRYSVELQEHLRSGSTSLEVIVPSFDNIFLSPLAQHFGYTEDEMKAKISESVATCVSVAIDGKLGKDSVVRVYMHKDRPCYSLYQFDNKILIGTYYSSRARRRAPMFLFKDKPGSMYEEFNSDLTQVISEDSEVIYDSSNGTNKLKEALGDKINQVLKGKLEKSN